MFGEDDDPDQIRIFSTNDLSNVLRFQNELLRLKELAQKTSVEKEILLTESYEEDSSVLNRNASRLLSERYSSFQDRISAILEQKHSTTNCQFEQTEDAMDTFREEFLAFKDSIENKFSSLALDYLDNSSFKERHRHNVEELTQTNEAERCCTDAFQTEIFRKENLKTILSSIKDCMGQLIAESKCNWKNSSQEISDILKQHHKDIKQFLEHSINENAEWHKKLQVDALLVQIEDIEKQLLDVFLFLDRKLIDVQAICQTLKFFNRKFEHFADKCVIRWNESCSRYENACNIVREAQDKLNFNSSKMSRISCSLTHHSGELKELMKELKDIVQRARDVTESASLETSTRDRIEEVAVLVEEVKVVMTRIEKDYSLKVRDIAATLKKPGEKLKPLLQYIEDLEILNDLVKNIASTYESMVTSSSSGKSGLIDNVSLRQIGDLESKLTITSQEELNQNLDFLTEFSFVDQNNAKQGKESLMHIQSKKKKSVLSDVFKETAVEPVEKGDVSHSKSKLELPLSQTDGRVYETLDSWCCIPSEMALSDINSDCLVENSSSSSGSEEY